MSTRPVTADSPPSQPSAAAGRTREAARPLAKGRRWRRAGWLALAVMVLGLAGTVSWIEFFRPVTVDVAPLETNVREQVFGLGTVGARVQSNVGFKVAGVLVALNADQGDLVRAGQALAGLDAHDIEAQVAVMKAGVAQARANVEKAK